MPDAHVYQIFYSEQTRQSLDAGFIPLDNLRNERPDWREYWPIRNFLLNTPLEAEHLYGFLSPKFTSKTGLDSDAVYRFIGTYAGSADVLLFSPYFDQIAYFLNCVEQAITHHPGLAPVLEHCATLVAPQFRVGATLASTLDTVYCNYFVAKGLFWNQWLEKCEQIFELAERGTGPIAQGLNAFTTHDRSAAPTKVFVIERVAPLLLSQSTWRVRAHDPLAVGLSPAPISAFPAQLVMLDALKIAYRVHRQERYREVFLRLRESLVQGIQDRQAGR